MLIVYTKLQFANTFEKVQSISEQVAKKLDQDCQCSISPAYLTAAQLSCDPKEKSDIIFRARLSSTQIVSDADLINILRAWVTSGKGSATLDFIQYSFDSNCEVLIQTFSDPICPASVVPSETSTTDIAKSKESSSTVNIIWPIVGAIVGGVVLILVVIIAIQIFNQCRKSRKYRFG